MATRTYRISFTPVDDKSTDPDELLWEYRTGPGGTGTLLAIGRATSGVATSFVVTDTELVAEQANARYLVIYDGAGNSAESEIEVDGPAVPDDVILEAPVVSIDFVYEWRDHRYALMGDLTPSVVSAEVDLDNDRPVARTARFRMDPRQWPAGFDPKSDRMSIRARFRQRGVSRQYPLGLFALDVSSEEYSPAGNPADPSNLETEIIVDVAGGDMIAHLVEATIDQPYTIAAGASYIGEIQTLIDGVTFADSAGNVTPMRRDIVPDELGTLTPVDFTWPPGSARITIINDLAMGISYWPLWADAEGVLRSRPRDLPWNEPIAVLYATQAEPRMVLPPFVRDFRHGSAVNKVLVVVDDPSRDPDASSRENSDPRSLISTANAKPVLVTVPAGRVAATGGLLTRLADQELAQAHVQANLGRLTTMFDPRRGNRETYKLQLAGVENDTRWQVLGWSLSMETGAPMRHIIGRADQLDFEDLTL
jgi:hypothetical protein